MATDHPTPVMTDDRELDIQVAEALGYRWYNAHGACNLVNPSYFNDFIKPSIPIIFKEGRKPTDEVRIDAGRDYMWPVLPMFSSNLIEAMHAADIVGLFESHNPPQNGQHGYVLTRICNDYAAEGEQWQWHIAQIDNRGIMQGFVAAPIPQVAICKAIIKFQSAKGE